ncbi:MAG: hypothetical protein LBI76_16485 [Comamonas sp.]|jgi:hypothetical protein|nr:hypothetical protein [Comamonas sp.]
MKHPKLHAFALSAALALACAGQALAESRYSFAPDGTGTVTATAKVNLSVVVPKLILLKVGSSNDAVDTVSWATSLSIPGTPATTPTATVTNSALPWDGNAPTVSTTPTGNAISVAAWTNAGNATINCAVGDWSAAGGPTTSEFTVATSGTLTHPGTNLGTCTSTSLSSNALATGTWTYTLNSAGGDLWKAGTFKNTVTYTASGV